MKQIVAVVKPFVVEKVVQALEDAEFEELIVREAQGYGKQKNYLEEYGQSEYALAFLPKVEILVWVQDEQLEPTIDIIVRAARTGRIGDGKILVLPAG